MISTVTNHGKLRFMLYQEVLTDQRLIRFLGRLIRDAEGHKVLLILDNLRVHHSKKVSAWVAERKAHLELFFLPVYALELNPEPDSRMLALWSQVSAGEFWRGTAGRVQSEH